MIECLENGIVQGLIMKRLSESITDMVAYKAGLIDENGNQIREPDTIEEKNMLTGADKYMIRVKNLMKGKLDLLNVSLYYEKKEPESLEEIKSTYEAELLCRDEIVECVDRMVSIMDDYSTKGISSSKIEQMIIEALYNEKKM
jgi:hypothetical protein